MLVSRFFFVLCFLFVGLAVATGNPPTDEPEEKEGGLFAKLMKYVRKEQEIPMPECLITLSGGVEEIEHVLQDGLQDSKSWAVLITSKSDQGSLDAVREYYEAVRQLCGEEKIEGLTPPSEPEAVSEQADGVFDSPASSEYEFDPSMLEKMKFAHMSFDAESKMMWRWWIWKVPSIIFVTPSTSRERIYDLRFWKIAFRLPTYQKLIAAFSDELWKDLPVWVSEYAPGGAKQDIAHYFSFGSVGFMSIFERVPNWLMGILASMFGSLLLTYLHRGKSSAQGSAAAESGPATTKKTQ